MAGTRVLVDSNDQNPIEFFLERFDDPPKFSGIWLTEVAFAQMLNDGDYIRFTEYDFFKKALCENGKYLPVFSVLFKPEIRADGKKYYQVLKITRDGETIFNSKEENDIIIDLP